MITFDTRTEFDKWAVEHDLNIAREDSNPDNYKDFITEKFYNCYVSAVNRTLTILNESLKKELEKF